MYKSFFGLNRNPFELSPDPSFNCWSRSSGEALASIQYAVDRRKGFVVLTGEVGTGKTLVVRSLCDFWKGRQIPFANIIGPRLSVIDFLNYVTFDLGIKSKEPRKGDLLRALYLFLLAQFEKGLTTVLVIDEAQQIPPRVLEEIRMLTNFETTQQKLLQIILVGQPELDTKLDSFELRQLKQRIAIRCRLEPLSEEETRRYIQRRLTLAGASSLANPIFPEDTVGVIFRYSAGIPRLVNNICEHALVAAYARQVRVVPADLINEIASYFRLQPSPSSGPAEERFSLAEKVENSVPKISWPPASSRSVSVENTATPSSTDERAPVAESAETTAPSEPETPFIPIGATEDVRTSATASTVTNVSTFETDRQRPGTALPERKSGMDRLAAPVLAPRVLASISELPDVQAVLDKPSGIDGKSERAQDCVVESEKPKDNLSVTAGGLSPVRTAGPLRTASQNGWGASPLSGAPGHTEKASKSRHNWILIGFGVFLLFDLAGGGVLWFRWTGGGNAAVSSAAVVAPPLVASNVGDNSITQAAQSSLSNAGAPEDTRVSTSEQSLLSAPPTRLAPKLESGLLESLNAHPSSRRADAHEVSPAPPLNPGAASLTDTNVLAYITSSSGLVPLHSDTATPGPSQNGSQLQPPRLLSSGVLTYPGLAQRMNVHGDVVIRTLIDQRGKVSDMQVVSGPLILRQAALDALRQSIYEPGRLDGQPVSMEMQVTLNFHQ